MKEEIYDDLAFMSSDYSPQEYYKFFSKRIVLENKKGLSSIIKKWDHILFIDRKMLDLLNYLFCLIMV